LPHFKNHTDQDLLKAISEDNTKAFNEFFRRYWRHVHAMAYARVRSREVTEEIVQELFISLWSKRANLSIHNIHAYLYQAVKFKALNYIESKLVEEKYWMYYKTFIPQEDNQIEAALDYDGLMEDIERGMKHLPEKSQRVFRLHRIEGWSVSEIADLLNLSEKAIQYHITQSIKKLRVHLKNYILVLAAVLGVVN